MHAVAEVLNPKVTDSDSVTQIMIYADIVHRAVNTFTMNNIHTYIYTYI